MDSLIDKLVHVEGEAGDLVEQARTEARKLEKLAEGEIERIRREFYRAAEERIDAFRADAAHRHEAEAAAQQAAHNKTLEAVGLIPAAQVSRQVERIVARFQEM